MTSSEAPAPELPAPFDRAARPVVIFIAVFIGLFVLVEVNYNLFKPISAVAIFVMLGLVVCFLLKPVARRFKGSVVWRLPDVVLALLTVFCFGYVVVQTEEFASSWWIDGQSLGDRAGAESTLDVVVGIMILLLVLEATRRAIGWVVPILCGFFLLHSLYCYYSGGFLPRFLLPHPGSSAGDLAASVALHSTGVLGQAASVMLRYVFLFVLFGAFLELSGATGFIIEMSQRAFGKYRGGPAYISILSSLLTGTLSGSAVANAVTTGTFTIPMMRRAGFRPHTAAAIEAAASSGGALVPPVMGAAAYMMLELVTPSVTFLQVCRAAIVPSILYYFSLFAILYFYSRRHDIRPIEEPSGPAHKLSAYEGAMFFGSLAILIYLLLWGFTAFKAVTAALSLLLAMILLRRNPAVGEGPRYGAAACFALATGGYCIYANFFADTWRGIDDPSMRQYVMVGVDSLLVGMFGLIAFGLLHPAWRKKMLDTFYGALANSTALIATSACVGIIIAVVQQSGMANDVASAVKGVVEHSLFLALVGVMCCSILLGMGVPSVVCYLLLATLMGPLLSELGVIPLGAHLFIFYFGMMSMVTPPVALAAYASASIAGADAMQASFAAFRFALVGFTLPFMFVYRPSLLLLDGEKWDIWFAAQKGAGPYADAASIDAAAQALAVAQTAFPPLWVLLVSIAASMVGITALASGIVGYFRNPMGWPLRMAMFGAALLLLAPNVGGREMGAMVNFVGVLAFAGAIVLNRPPGERRG